MLFGAFYFHRQNYVYIPDRVRAGAQTQAGINRKFDGRNRIFSIPGLPMAQHGAPLNSHRDLLEMTNSQGVSRSVDGVRYYERVFLTPRSRGV